MTRPPTTLGSARTFTGWIAFWLATTTVAVTLPYSRHAPIIAGIGWLLVTTAVWHADRTTLSTGCLVLYTAILVAAGDGAPLLLVLAGTTATVLAWDIGHHGISITRQLGPHAHTARAARPHATASITAGLIITTLAYTGLTLTTTLTPTTPVVAAVAFLLITAGLLAIALGPPETTRIHTLRAALTDRLTTHSPDR